MMVPKSLNQQAYSIGREHGEKRARHAIATQLMLSVAVPPELSGHGAAGCQYLQGQDDGFMFVMDAHGAKLQAQRDDMIAAGMEEMDRLEAGDQ